MFGFSIETGDFNHHMITMNTATARPWTQIAFDGAVAMDPVRRIFYRSSP